LQACHPRQQPSFFHNNQDQEMTEITDDNELQLLKASAGLVDGVNSLLARLLWKTPSRDTKKIRVHRVAKWKKLGLLMSKVRANRFVLPALCRV
jgi:hypothetical protein